MATRDLTRKFNDYRTTAKIIGRNSLSPLSGYTMDSGLLEDAHRDDGMGGWQAARMQLPPAWVDLVDRVDALTAKVEGKMKELEALHRARLLVGFDDSEAAKERDIDLMTQEITAMLRESESVLRRLASADGGGGDRGTEGVVTRNVQRSMAKRIQTLSIGFRRSQKEYMARLKAQKQGLPGALQASFDFLSADHGLLEAERRLREEGKGAGFTPEQLALLEQEETLTAERDQEIQHIARSIEELSQIFKELAVLVIDQGTVLDRIDFNMEQVVEHTKEGVHQLVRAEENQKSAKATKCIIFLLIAIFVMIVILFLKHR